MNNNISQGFHTDGGKHHHIPVSSSNKHRRVLHSPYKTDIQKETGIFSLMGKVSRACKNFLSSDLLGTDIDGYYHFEEDYAGKIQVVSRN